MAELELDTFNPDGIYRALATLPRPETPAFLKPLRPRFDIHVFEQVASTNQMLWAMPTAKAGTVAIAHTQTQGKGQRGKQWLSSAGGVYLSLMLEPDWSAEQSPHLTLCSAWGIVSQFRCLQVAAQIKWPNDIVVSGLKLGGILSESKLERGLITRAVIGVGINVLNPVPDTGIAWHQLPSPASRNTLNEVAAAVLLGLWRGFYYRNQTSAKNFTHVYQSLLTHLNRPVVLEGKTLKIVGITEAGHLTLKATSPELASNAPPVEQTIHLKPGELSLGYVRSEVG